MVIAIGLAIVPPVSSPTKVDQERSRVFLVAETKVRSPGLVGSIPANVTIWSVQAEYATKF